MFLIPRTEICRVKNRDQHVIIIRSLRINFNIIISRLYSVYVLVFRPNPLLKSNLFIVNYKKKTMYLNNSITRGDLQVIRLYKVTVIKYKASTYLIRDSLLLE